MQNVMSWVYGQLRQPGSGLSASLAAGSAPGLKLHTLQAVGIRVPEEDGWAARHAAGEGHAGSLQQGRQPVQVSHSNAEVTVTTTVLCKRKRKAIPSSGERLSACLGHLCTPTIYGQHVLMCAAAYTISRGPPYNSSEACRTYPKRQLD